MITCTHSHPHTHSQIDSHIDLHISICEMCTTVCRIHQQETSIHPSHYHSSIFPCQSKTLAPCRLHGLSLLLRHVSHPSPIQKCTMGPPYLIMCFPPFDRLPGWASTSDGINNIRVKYVYVKNVYVNNVYVQFSRSPHQGTETYDCGMFLLPQFSYCLLLFVIFWGLQCLLYKSSMTAVFHFCLLVEHGELSV